MTKYDNSRNRKRELIREIHNRMTKLKVGTDAPVQLALEIVSAATLLYGVVLEDSTLIRAEETGDFDRVA